MKKSLINTAVAAALIGSSTVASAAIQTFEWDGFFTMLDPAGAALANSSITAKGANQFQTPVTGTMAFDNSTFAGTATLVPFDFFGGSAPAEAIGINMQSVGDGIGGAGPLILGNMLFNWNGNNGIPVSIVMDASGFFGATSAMFGDGQLDGTDVAAFGGVPASDGTYNAGIPGDHYLNLGPVPMSTTSMNTTSALGCGPNDGSCDNNGDSGKLPLIVDTKPNGNDYDLTTPTLSDLSNEGIGGSPFQSGPFPNFNPNFDITVLRPAALVAGGNAPEGYVTPSSIGPFAAGPEVPVPAAVWLFGSGLLGLVGVARRKKSEV